MYENITEIAFSKTFSKKIFISLYLGFRVLKPRSVKVDMLEKLKPQLLENSNTPGEKESLPSRVIKSLQAECDSTKPQQTFRFTKEQVKWISYLMDKHHDDYQVVAIKCKYVS